MRDRFFLQQLQSPLLYGPTQLDFSQITARAGGGEITGRFTMQPQTQDSPFTVSVKFRDVQADRIISEAGGVLGTVTGKLEGYLNANGTTADPNALTGAGEIILRDGQVRQYSLLVALGQLLQIQELQQLHLDQAQVKYHIDPGVVTIDELRFPLSEHPALGDRHRFVRRQTSARIATGRERENAEPALSGHPRKFPADQ